jgi:hypothetical protein
MYWTGKLIGGLLGFFIFGPVGALIGVVLGHFYDEHLRRMQMAGSGPTGPSEDAIEIGARFFRTAFEVMGHVAKADGRVSEREIDAARAVMSELRLNEAQMQVAIGHFRAGKDPDYSLDAALQALRRSCTRRPDLLRVFVEIQMRAALTGNDLAGCVLPRRSVSRPSSSPIWKQCCGSGAVISRAHRLRPIRGLIDSPKPIGCSKRRRRRARLSCRVPIVDS